jgi:hyperosmotically inducible periplasmic protein
MRHIVPTLFLLGLLAGCSSTTQSPDVAPDIRKSLNQAGLKDVSVSQDRDKGVVTLSGHVPADADKVQAESMAKSMAAGQVVANQITVLPPGMESDSKKIASALDDGISSNVKAALLKNSLNDGVDTSVTAGVVTLTGHVDSQAKRARVEKLTSDVPNVKQVVNELQVKDQKATSRGGGQE